MLGRKERLQIAQHASGILRASGALERIKHEGYTRVDPFKIATIADLVVMKRQLQDLLGGFVRDSQSGILVNIDRPPGMVHMTCAHELGHYFLGHETTVDQALDYGSKGDTKEREADWFAYHLLMPRSLIVDIMKRKGWQRSDLKRPGTLYQLSLRLGTSFTATYWTLISLELLTIGPSEGEKLYRTSLQRLKHELVTWERELTLSDVWVLDENDRDRVLEPRPQDRFIVDLPNHTSAGYLWSLDEVVDAGFKLRPLTEEIEPVRSPTGEVLDIGQAGLADGAPLIVGGRGRQRYVLEHGVEEQLNFSGEPFALEFKEAQPWRKDLRHKDNFKLTTEFESMALGLDKRSQERLLAEVAGE